MGDGPQGPGELAYIAQLLHGNAPEPPQAPAQVPRGRGRGRGPRGRGGRGRAAPSAGAGPSAAPAPAAAERDPLNRPRESSSPKLWHCEACDVLVPRRPGDWEVHVAGIRHRRQVLSLREHGQRGRLVLSVFETGPQPGAQAPLHRLAGNAAGAFGLGPPAAAPAQGDAEARRRRLFQSLTGSESIGATRTAALAQMLGMYGRSRLFDAASSLHFGADQLTFGQMSAGALLSQGKGREQMECLAGLAAVPAILAYLGAAARAGTLPGPLPPLLIVRMAKGDAGTSGVAAWLCSLLMVLGALAARPSGVKALWVGVQADLHPAEGLSVLEDEWHRVLGALRSLLASPQCGLDEMRLFLEGRGAAGDDEWGPGALEDSDDSGYNYSSVEDSDGSSMASMDSSSGGASAGGAMSDGGGGGGDAASDGGGDSEGDAMSDSDEEGPPPEDGAQLIAESMEALEGLRAAAAGVAAARRRAVAMAAHPRVGRCSALQLLPAAVLEKIALMAAPRGGCRVEIERRFLPRPGPEWGPRSHPSR